jgi:hypothetical protein
MLINVSRLYCGMQTKKYVKDGFLLSKKKDKLILVEHSGILSNIWN